MMFTRDKNKRTLFAFITVLAAFLCAVMFVCTGRGPRQAASAEEPTTATTRDLQLANEYKAQNGIVMSARDLIDIERTCTGHETSRRGDTILFNAVFSSDAAAGKTFERLWVYTESYGGRWDTTNNLGAVSGKPYVTDTDGTKFAWVGSGLAADNAGGTIHQTNSITLASASGYTYFNGTNGLNLDNNARSWYVFELTDDTADQKLMTSGAAGSVSGMQTLKSFSWGINHYQTTSHIALGDIYGETADGEKVLLFDAATATVKDADDSAAEGNYVYKSYIDADNCVSCFTVKKVSNAENFTDGAATGTWCEFMLPLLGMTGDMSDYAGFSFYVHNPLEKPIFFNKYFLEKSETQGLMNLENNTPSDNHYEQWYDNLNVGNMQADGGETEYRQQIQTIPAGFGGRVYVPFSTFVVPEWKKLPDNASRMDLDDMSTLNLTFLISDNYAKGAFGLKEFRLEAEIEVPVPVYVRYQWEDGTYKEALMYEEMLNDGSQYDVNAAAGEKTFNGHDYIIDAALTKWEKDDPDAYDNNAPAVRRNGGNVSFNYTPRLYYKFKDDFTLRKVFLPKAIQRELPFGADVDEIASGLPHGFTFGNQYGGLMEIAGTWSVTDKTDGGATFVFAPSDELPSNIIIPDESVFAVRLSISTVAPAPPAITGITLKAPMMTVFCQGDKLELAGMIVTALYDDGTTSVLAPDDYEVTGYDSSLVGEQTITVKVGDKTATFKITVIENPDYKVEEPSDGGEKKGGCGGGKELAGVLAALTVVLGATIIRRK